MDTCRANRVQHGKALHRTVMDLVVLGLAAASLALALLLAGLLALHAGTPAYADIHTEPVPEPVATAPAGSDGGATDAADANAAADGETIIEDEDVPMYSGLGGGEPVASGGVDLQWIVVAGIVVVAVVFLVLTKRTNSSISKMKRNIR